MFGMLGKVFLIIIINFFKNTSVSKMIGKLSSKIFVTSKFIKYGSIQKLDLKKTLLIPNNLDIDDFKNFIYQNLNKTIEWE